MAFARGKLNELEPLIGNIDLEYRILSYYFRINMIPTTINSPIRLDHSPSFHIYSNSKGRVKWIDYGTGDFGDLWNLLARYWKCSITSAEERVREDLPKLIGHETHVDVIPTTAPKGKVVHNEKTKLQVRVREWKNHDLEYWQSYGIPKPWAVFGEIYPISHMIITKDSCTKIIPADKYAYAFLEYKDGKPSIKVYQPFSKSYKWISKHDRSTWDLWANLPERGDKLIITSSRKDALCIWANTGIPSTGLQGEGYLPKEHVVAELKSRFNEVYVLYDNDFRSEINYGREYGKKLAETFGLKQIEIPTSYHKKDSSDLYHAYGRATLREVIFGLTNQRNNYENDVPF